MATTHTSVKDTSKVATALEKAESNINAKPTTVKKTTKKVESGAISDSDKLRAFVTKNALALKKSNGKTYLMAEAWQFVARLKGLIPSFESVSEIDTTADSTGKTVRYLKVTTTCILKREADLEEVSRATIVATSLEKFLSDKPAYAIWGMSETRALSRAIRNIYGYIASDAGYQATPLEEIQD